MAWNKKIHIAGIFCELTNTFDCVNPDVLIAKLEYYGIQESTLNWFKSYLSNRRQGTKLSIKKEKDLLLYLGNCEARTTTRVCVMALYSLLYTLMIYQWVQNTFLKAILFADGTSVIATDKDHDSIKRKTNRTLTSLNQWFYINHLMLNIAKTNVIKFTRISAFGYLL